MKLILVPTDMSETAARALRYASALAARFDAHLLVLYADPFAPPVDFAGTAAFAPRLEDLIETAREQLELHTEQNVNPAVPYDTRVVASSPVNAILEQACDTGADLIVMGTHGRTGIRRLFAGSVTEAVIRLATIPVIAVSPDSHETPTLDRVVCPITFTLPSLEAMRYAATMAESASLLFFRGVEATEVRKTIDEVIALQDWTPRELLGRAELKVIPTAASAEDIIAVAKQSKADLIALGIPAAPHLLENILHLSPCPVLTINERTVRLSLPEGKLPLSAMVASQ